MVAGGKSSGTTAPFCPGTPCPPDGDDDDDDDDDDSDSDSDSDSAYAGHYYCSPDSDTKLQSIVLEYTGEDCDSTENNQSRVPCKDLRSLPNHVQISATGREKGDKYTYFDSSSVFEGDEITLTPEAVNGIMVKTTVVRIYDAQELAQYVRFHTSCSQSLEVGDQFGSLLVKAITTVPE